MPNLFKKIQEKPQILLAWLALLGVMWGFLFFPFKVKLNAQNIKIETIEKILEEHITESKDCLKQVVTKEELTPIKDDITEIKDDVGKIEDSIGKIYQMMINARKDG